MFTKCVETTANEDIVKRSPRGRAARKILLAIQKLDHFDVSGIAVSLITACYSSITAGFHHKLPSVAQCSVWKAFHKVRNAKDIEVAWTGFIAKKQLDPTEIHLTLQLLLFRLLKGLLKNLANSKREGASASTVSQLLTQRERNAIRYMSGYVAISLLKRFKRPVSKAELHEKHELFVKVLSQMKAENQPSGVDSIADYTRLWSELIDRGGLYHIGDEVTPSYLIISLDVHI